MAEEPKKISFGFTKINKKTAITVTKNEEKKIQFIDCLEGNSIKLINGEEKEKAQPIIPLRNGNILRDNMIEALKARKNKPANEPEQNGKVLENETEKNMEDSKPLTLDEQAAKEILEDLKKEKETDEIPLTLTIPQQEAIQISEKESTLEDYESMPVNQFGMAVLRGMGWTPDKGIGKTAQIVKPVNPVVRPKGMGLGADKVMSVPKPGSKEEIVMKKGASLKVISGLHKGMYGQVEGFDELPGRIIVRWSLQNNVISISENLVELVTLSEYNKNSKILNLKEYNNFLNKETIPVAREAEEKSENNKATGSSNKTKVEYSKEEERKYRKEQSSVEYSKYKDKRYYSSGDKYKKNNKMSDSDESFSDSESRPIKTKHSSSRHKSSNYRHESRGNKDSDSESSVEKNKSRSHKHKKSKSRHRSRSRSVSRKKKHKKNRHRSRS